MGKVALSLTYVFPLLVVGFLFARNKISSVWIYALLGFLPIIYVAHWFSLELNEGWPTQSEIPESFQLISASVIEPNKQIDHPGAIYLWLRQTPADPPRNHHLPYSRALHERLQRSLDRLQQGHRQIGNLSGRESGGSGPSQSDASALSFEDAPPPKLPPKGF
ncbi:MAG: hypothetical protein KTR18_01610 [Acidiferrobacterales bacterium]|nr:hypothetical protein [Acidiferrobacterales bacterium]